jgi:hypothetical protein
MFIKEKILREKLEEYLPTHVCNLNQFDWLQIFKLLKKITKLEYYFLQQCFSTFWALQNPYGPKKISRNPLGYKKVQGTPLATKKIWWVPFSNRKSALSLYAA